jgi:hypothetical protein
MKLPNRAKKERGRTVYFTSDVEQVLDRSGAMPTADEYGGYPGNYGSHCMSFGFMGITFWFSYSTLIAFHVPGYEQVVLKNYWGPTTGRHIGSATQSWKTERVEDTEFIVRLNNQLRGYLGITKLTLPFLRVDADPKTLERSGFIGARMAEEEDVPPPKPKKSEFYLHPKKDTKDMKQKRAREAREEKQRLERLRQKQSIDDEYGDQLREYQGAMI